MKKAIIASLFLFSLTANAQEKEWFDYDEWVVVEISTDNKELIKTRKDKITDRASGWFQYKRKNETDTVLYYANCNTSQIFEAVGVTHDNKGNAKAEWKGKEWHIVVPETIEETIYNVICEGKSSVDRYGMEMLEYLMEMKEKKNKKNK